MNQKVVPDPQSIGKQLNADEPTHGHRQHVTAEAKAEALDSKGSFDTALKADPPPKGALTPEQIMALDEIPSDPKEIEKLLGQEFGDKSRETGPEGDGQVHRQQEAIERGEATAYEAPALPPPVADKEQAQKKDAKTEAGASATATSPGEQSQAEFVESRDGKHRIPYKVLENERRTNARLNSELAAAQAQIEQLRKGQVAGEARSTQAEAEEHNDAADKAAAGALTDEDFAALEESFPAALVTALKKINGIAVESRSVVREIETEAERAEAADKHAAGQSVQDIIDRDPVLTEIQQDEEKWQEAVQLDDALMKSKRWAGKSVTERFAEVKRLMGYEPDPAQPSRTEPTAEEQAAEKIRQAGIKQQKQHEQGRAFTHSDLPGGNPPPQSERDSVANMDIHSLGRRVEGMNQAQLDRFLASI